MIDTYRYDISYKQYILKNITRIESLITNDNDSFDDGTFIYTDPIAHLGYEPLHSSFCKDVVSNYP